jgi:hypothetical protein
MCFFEHGCAINLLSFLFAFRGGNIKSFIAYQCLNKYNDFIKKLKDDSGTWIEDRYQIRGMAGDYFSNLFIS